MQLDKLMKAEEVYRSSRQPPPNRKIVKETVFPVRAKSALKHDDGKLESTSCATQTYGDLRRGRRGPADMGIMGRSKAMGSNQQPSFKVQEGKDDELVKYMSNLPGYLQHVEKELQDKVLNFGVLDWARLQKWKEKQKFVPATDGYNASAVSCHLATKSTQRSSKPRTAEHREVVNRQNEQHHCPCSRPNSSGGDQLFRDAKPSIRDMMQFRDLEAASSSRLSGQKKLQSTHKQSSKNLSETIVGTGSREDFDHKIDSSKLKSRPDVSYAIRKNDGDGFYDAQFKKRMESKKELGIRKKDLDLNVTSNVGVVPTRMRNYEMLPHSKGEKNAYGVEPRKITEKLQEPAVDTSNCQGSDKKNIVLLVPTKSSRNSSSECSSTSFGENSTEADQDSSSDCFTFGESHISEHESRIPHSCPLPSGADKSTEQQKMATKSSQGMVLSSDTPRKYARARRMLVMPSESDGIKTLNQNAEPSKVMDQETAELVIQKGRHTSPNRRFSFSLGRMTRSFSFKESSGGVELISTDSSVKSGPVTTKASSFDSNREKASGNSRSRSSPLKRILEPLLKSKSINPQHSAGSDRPPEGSLKSVSFKPSQAFNSQSGNHGKSSIQALMHHVVANGQPVFRFVVDNNRTFMATIKSLASPKEEPKCNFTFYSVDEIHKKSGNWINQGSREKNVSYVYNVIGHMKVNSSFPDMTEQNATGQRWAKECVLYGVERRQGDKPSPVFVPSGELAALVLTSPGNDEELIGNGLSDRLPEDGYPCSSGEKYHDEVTAILPGAIHSLPSKGAPSPLIQRWKTGGVCDCGGWDIGCKLQILKNRRQSFKTPRTFTAYRRRECFELFVQGESQQDKAVFGLRPIEKGLYSIEFSQSISLLQAFFISVTVTNLQTSSDLPQLNNLRKEQTLQERKNVMKKIPDNVLLEPILKYTQGPPLSPVGRV